MFHPSYKLNENVYFKATVATVKVLDVFGVLENGQNNGDGDLEDMDDNRDGDTRIESLTCRMHKDQVGFTGAS